jgi:MarR family transcriptional regulator, temperature-dependent positive regulator of motility
MELAMQKRTSTRASLDEGLVHLLHRVSQRADEVFIREMGGTGLTPRQFAVLLAAAQNEKSSQTDLVERTGIDRSTVAEMVRRMVKKGLLQRRRSRQDARAYAVRVTEEGRRTLDAAQPRAERAGAAVLENLSGEQRKVLVDALMAIARS